ncbi:hypothetical protein NA57DRAFT_57794 [Rhizodiscina lignyota]|uniref:Uncharacterized protein n=1 Tax=Rhizodiscina lignyota TaxID=1504668 RepID=A0A9P4M4U9_9PEZI|nr:hypothetical protein NA57DRAFT_57794 [Rhizodiscina lignyota]
MCVAELNRSTGPCSHTYFRLTKPCSTGSNLANCGKLSLSGWENRTDACAFCNGSAALDPSNYRLLGYDDAGGIGPAHLSRTNSLSTMTTSSLASARRDSRRGSLARSDSSTGSSSYGYGGGAGSYNVNVNPGAAPTTAAYAMTPLTQIASERNIQRNQRIDSYLAQLPEHVSRAGKQSMYVEPEGTSGRSRANSTSSGGTGASGTNGVEAHPGVPTSKRWSMKGKRLAKIF